MEHRQAVSEAHKKYTPKSRPCSLQACVAGSEKGGAAGQGQEQVFKKMEKVSK